MCKIIFNFQSMESRNIKAISRGSVHKICSGQVVLTLATAVKELVENSIDAESTIIEVKLKEYGSESIEVIDNGKGVKESDFQGITLKHHTSKISDFSDVSFVSTFGFRGEALSSLCALSDVEIITCHRDASVGTHLIYDHDGAIIKSSPTHRQVGTTIILKNLFYTLPVRHKEFLRNVRREYAKMIQLLTAYCLITLNKRISCTNITDKGRKTLVLSTNSCNTYKDNIACIFDNKQINNLMEFVQYSPSESVLEEYFLPMSELEKCKIFKIEGYISNSTHGEGRSSTDRQFFFINGRPCDLPKISKLINEVYHSFNKAQYPFVFLNIILTEGSADVNVTPDKRQIFIPEEKLLLSIIKASLYQLYQVQPSQMKMSDSSLFFKKSNQDFGSHEVLSSTVSNESEESLKRKVDSLEENPEDAFSPPFKSLRNNDFSVDDKETVENIKENFSDFISSSSQETEITHESQTAIIEKEENLMKSTEQKSHINGINFTLTLPVKEEKIVKNINPKTTTLREILQKAYRGSNPPNFDMSKKLGKIFKQKKATDKKITNFLSTEESKTVADFKLNDNSREVDANSSLNKDKLKDESKSENNSDMPLNSPNFERTVDNDMLINSPDLDSIASDGNKEESFISDNEVLFDTPQARRKKSKVITFDIETIKESLKAKSKAVEENKLIYRKFRSKITPTDNTSAEKELKKEIKKDDFAQMDIIGQFNLGFIIARLKEDLFIIDQHATDEKYNFETLQKDTILETQKLLNPQNLHLTAVSEAVLLDNLHIFEKSGFKFSINEENSVGNKVQLVSVPVSQNWRFGKEDVDEMIFMLTDNPVSLVRPSRVNQMFASRACRKSVMIGTALTVPMMRKLVLHMGEIEQPWNCPHGRPTMRHLFNLNLLKTD